MTSQPGSQINLKLRQRKVVVEMANPPKGNSGKPGKNPKQTSPKVASEAGRVLNNKKATSDEKSAAASALAQARLKSKSAKKK